MSAEEAWSGAGTSLVVMVVHDGVLRHVADCGVKREQVDEPQPKAQPKPCSTRSAPVRKNIGVLRNNG